MQASDILEMKVVAGKITLVAGAQGLDKTIRRVTVMEAPDLPDLLSGGELVLTTLYQLRDDVAEQEKLVRRMNEKGVSALLIKMGRFVSDIAPEVKAAADEVRLPLMAVTKDIVFRDLIYEVVQNLVEEDSEDRDSQIVDAVARSDNVRQICETIEQSWLSPCALIGPAGHLIEVSSTAAHRQYIAWSGLIREHLVASGDDRRAGPKGAIVLRKQDVGAPEEGISTSALLFSCRPGGKLIAYLTVFGPGSGIPGALATQVASILALRLLQDASGIEAEHAERLRTIEGILASEESGGDLAERLASLGFDQVHSYTVILCRFTNRWQEIPHIVGRYVSQMKAEFPSSASAPRGTEVVSLLGLREEPLAALARVRRQLPGVQRVVSYHPSFAGLAVGSFEVQPSELRRSYENCRSVTKLGGLFYDDLLLEIALSRVADSTEAALLKARFLDPVVEYDRQYGSGLLKTLQLYVNMGDLQEVANRLHLHPNTVRYRLRKIAEITTLDPETPRGITHFSVLLTIASHE